MSYRRQGRKRRKNGGAMCALLPRFPPVQFSLRQRLREEAHWPLATNNWQLMSDTKRESSLTGLSRSQRSCFVANSSLPRSANELRSVTTDNQQQATSVCSLTFATK